MVQTLNNILNYANGTGSVNFYMAHGGSNFGYWAGARWLIDQILTSCRAVSNSLGTVGKVHKHLHVNSNLTGPVTGGRFLVFTCSAVHVVSRHQDYSPH